jgi:hypothetical protein
MTKAKRTSNHARLEAVLPELQKELETAALADQVLRVRIRRDGSVDGVEFIARTDLASSGDERMQRPATIKPGEFAACWVLGEIEGVAGEESPVARAGLQPARGTWPPANLDDLLRQRTESLMPTLSKEVRRASEADDVLMLAFTGERVWSMRPGLMPRADMIARGDTFCAERPSLRAGEVWACWAIAVDSATGRYVPVRLSAVPSTKGGDA